MNRDEHLGSWGDQVRVNIMVGAQAYTGTHLELAIVAHSSALLYTSWGSSLMPTRGPDRLTGSVRPSGLP